MHPYLAAMLTATFSLAATLPVSVAVGAAPGDGGIPGIQFGPRGETETAAPTFDDSRQQVAVRITPAHEAVAPGGNLPLAVAFEHQEGWHIYSATDDIPSDYFRTAIVIDIPPDAPIDANSGFTQWPESHEIDFFGDKLFVYEGTAVAYVPLTVRADAAPGEYTIRIRAAFQACDDMLCLAPTPHPARLDSDEEKKAWSDYGTDVTIRVRPPSEVSLVLADTELFARFDTGVFSKIRAGEKAPQIVDFGLFGWNFKIDAGPATGFVLLLLVAAIGGFLLNLTPCVLPIIPLKIMGLSSAAGNRSKTLKLGTVMSLGVIALWLAIGLAIALVSGFTATNQLLNYPLFTITIGLFIAVMAIGMCGLFSLRLPQFVYGINPSHETYFGSFVFGIMTGILSTPCTAPFMGAAAAYAATIPPAMTLVIFAAIGIGMALPYQVLSAFPHLVDRMPRTGPASELIKQVMGLLMLAAAAFFVGTGLSGFLANSPQPPSRVYWWVVAALGIAAGGWMTWRTVRISKSAMRRIIFGGTGVLILVASLMIGVRFSDRGPIDWVYYTPEQFAAAKADGKVVVMEFTAEWCLNCKALEKTVLSSQRVVELLEEDDVVPIKVDLTGDAVLGRTMLKDVQRLTIPLIVIFAPNGEEKFKGDFYTVEQVVDAVRAAQASSVAAKSGSNAP